MVTNFEEYTHPLTADELVMLDLFVALVKHRTKKTAIKSGEIILKINAIIKPLQLKTQFNGARLRKISNHLRRNSLLPLCGTTVGYYCTDDPAEIEREIKSLRDRANAINAAADGLLHFITPQLTPPPVVQGSLFEEIQELRNQRTEL